MEKNLEQTAEELRSFNPLASVNMFRFDLDHFSEVRDETRERVFDEELSYLAEGIERASRTSFTLRREGKDLVYFSQGTWSPYMALLLNGLEAAKQEEVIDPRRAFLTKWAQCDWENGIEMNRLQPGEQMTWWNPYPHELETVYDVAFLKSCGLNPKRKMGFLYRASCQEDGSVTLESQTVDRSDTEGIKAVERLTTERQGATMDEMLNVYDRALATQYGERFYAGRKNAEIHENAWATIRQHKDLIRYFIEGIESLAKSRLQGIELERAAKRHTYGSWAAFKKRIDGTVKPFVVHKSSGSGTVWHDQLAQEVNQAFTQFVKSGEELIGCGGGIAMTFEEAERSIFDADAAGIFESIFGSDDKFGSLSFDCPNGHRNIRPRNELIPKCVHCGVSVKC